MRRLAVMFAVGAMCLWSQASDPVNLDLSSLNKLASKAKEANEVNLDPSQIHAAMQFMPHDDDDSDSDQTTTKKLLAGLQSVNVRNYEFEKEGEVRDSDLEPIRAQLSKLKGWGKIVDSKEKHEHSEVYLFSQDGKPMGIAVIDVEPRELSVVLVKGAINLSDLHKLHGMMGLPSIQIGPQPRTTPPTPPTPPPSKE